MKRSQLKLRVVVYLVLALSLYSYAAVDMDTPVSGSLVDKSAGAQPASNDQTSIKQQETHETSVVVGNVSAKSALGYSPSSQQVPTRNQDEIADSLSGTTDNQNQIPSAGSLVNKNRGAISPPLVTSEEALRGDRMAQAAAEDARYKSKRLAHLPEDIVKAAENYRDLQHRYEQMRYDLEYKTLSGEIDKKTAQIQQFAVGKVAPAGQRFGKLIQEYLALKGPLVLRDLAIKNGFLDLLQ